jgi:hypothetical protein
MIKLSDFCQRSFGISFVVLCTLVILYNNGKFSMIKLLLFECWTEKRGGCIGSYGVKLYDVTPLQAATKINNILQQ